MKELNKTSVDVKEESIEMPTAEPNQNQIIDGLAQQVIALDKENVKLKATIITLEERLDAIKKENERLMRSLEDNKKEVTEECKCCMPAKEEEYYISWEKKVAKLHSQLESEKTFYESQIKLLKHELIECPQREAILNKKIEYNTQHLKHVNRIIKAVLK